MAIQEKKISETIYITSDGRAWNDKDAAEKHEKDVPFLKKLRDLKTFEVTKNHLNLLKKINIWWADENNDHYGYAYQDWKRPYGNSDVYEDIAEVLGIEEKLIDGEPGYTDSDIFKIRCIHREMEICIKILISTLSISEGKYKRTNDYGDEWVKIK